MNAEALRLAPPVVQQEWRRQRDLNKVLERALQMAVEDLGWARLAESPEPREYERYLGRAAQALLAEGVVE